MSPAVYPGLNKRVSVYSVDFYGVAIGSLRVVLKRPLRSGRLSNLKARKWNSNPCFVSLDSASQTGILQSGILKA